MPKTEPIDNNMFQYTNDVYAAQPFQSPISPFTTRLPNHMQQYHLPDFMDTTPKIPTHAVPLDTLAAGDTGDLFSNDWTNLLSQPLAPSKITSYDDGTNWDDYLDGDDTNWLLASQPEQES